MREKAVDLFAMTLGYLCFAVAGNELYAMQLTVEPAICLMFAGATYLLLDIVGAIVFAIYRLRIALVVRFGRVEKLLPV